MRTLASGIPPELRDINEVSPEIRETAPSYTTPDFSRMKDGEPINSIWYWAGGLVILLVIIWIVMESRRK